MSQFALIVRQCFVILLSAVMVTACADTKPKTSERSKDSGGTGGSGGSSASGNEICSLLYQQQVANNPSYSDFVQEFCNGGGLAALRADGKQYRGTGSPNVDPVATQKGAQSQMRVWGSMATNQADARSYFNMMRLQTSRPDDFSNEGFEYDSAIKYTVNGINGTSVSYQYTNRKEELVVDYIATSNFIQAVPNKLYIVTSALDESRNLIKTFRALQVIYQYQGDQGQVTEVFSVADQLYDNNGDHATTVSKSRSEFTQDMARGFRNAAKASAANRYFP